MAAQPAQGRTRGPVRGHGGEHGDIAAASAAVQNLLLAATARGIPTYWSSGGVLRGPEVFGWMGIPAEQVLLGSIFLFPPDTRDAEVLPGSHRHRRGPPRAWSRWTELELDGS